MPHQEIVPSAALPEDSAVGHGLHGTIQIGVVLPFREDPAVILAAYVQGTVDIGIDDPAIRLPVQAPADPLSGEGRRPVFPAEYRYGVPCRKTGF
jgi:hypothetical protein